MAVKQQFELRVPESLVALFNARCEAADVGLAEPVFPGVRGEYSPVQIATMEQALEWAKDQAPPYEVVSVTADASQMVGKYSLEGADDAPIRDADCRVDPADKPEFGNIDDDSPTVTSPDEVDTDLDDQPAGEQAASDEETITD